MKIRRNKIKNINNKRCIVNKRHREKNEHIITNFNRYESVKENNFWKKISTDGENAMVDTIIEYFWDNVFDNDSFDLSSTIIIDGVTENSKLSKEETQQELKRCMKELLDIERRYEEGDEEYAPTEFYDEQDPEYYDNNADSNGEELRNEDMLIQAISCVKNLLKRKNYISYL